MARTINNIATEICSLRHGIENAAWEEARGKLMAYLRLRGSCVGGDHEEYDALETVIKEFIERIDEDDIYSPSSDEITRLREENARLREALEPFADVPTHGEFGGPMVQARVYYECEPNDRCGVVTISPNKFRAAAAAIREMSDE